MAVAGRTANWRAPYLAHHATGAALSAITRGLYADHTNGEVIKGAPVLHPKVAGLDPKANPTTVTISDCGDSTHWLLYRAKTGVPADPTPGGHRSITAVVKRQADGIWRVTGFAVRGLGTC